MNKLIEAKIESITDTTKIVLSDNQSLVITNDKLPAQAKVGDHLYLLLSLSDLSSDQEISHAIINELLNTNSDIPEIRL